MGDGANSDDSLPVYECEPPEWLPKAHASSDIGYPGFYPPRPGQDEDSLSEINIKNGFNIGHAVAAETFSAQDSINLQLHENAPPEQNALTKLEELMNEVFARRAEHIPAVPSSSFRMPSRVTLNDAKRQAWFADLANSDVPLHKLGKNVPHGAKGHDLLDLLQGHNVAIPRAVWFLRVFGANETAGLRNKPSYNPTQYSIDWANVVTSYMKKQLADIALPSAPRPGLNIKQTFKGVLADADSRDRWISRFTYCLKLLRTFYSEGLVDNRTFLTWLVQQMSTCNLAQAGFVARLADDYLDGMLGCRALTRPFAEACLNRLSEIRTTSAQEHLVHLDTLLKTLLQRICIALPDAFVSPKTWLTHSALLDEVLTASIVEQPADLSIEQKSRDVQDLLSDNFYDIKQRNDAMLFRNLPPRVLARLGSAVSDIQLLNSITSSTDLATLQFFESCQDHRSPTSFPAKLDILLTWSVTPFQYGDHRPYAAVSLLRAWRDRAEDRATRHDANSPDEFIQDQLFDWLDVSDVAAEEGNLRSVAILFGKLVKHELFSYANYIQRLIARGEPGLSHSQQEASRHRKFLRWIPLHNSTPSLVNQRKVTLHGARARETPEDLNEREIRKEIRAILPEIFGGEVQPNLISTAAFLDVCPTLRSASRYEQVRIFRQWLLPLFRKHVMSQGAGASNPHPLLKSYCMTVELIVNARCYGSLLDLNLFMLEHSSTNELLMAVIEAFYQHMNIWSAMNIMKDITTALFSAHQAWRSRSMQSRALLALLVEVDNGRHLDTTSREHVAADISSFAHALYPETEHPDLVPPVLPEILLLAEDPNPQAPSVLANSLWYKYRTAFDWSWKVWDNTVASLRQVPVMTSDIAGRRACALRYGLFLLHVDQHLPGGFDDQVLRWFLGPGKNEVAALSADAWDVLTVVLLYLSVHGALATTTILRGLVYPAWQLCANVATVQQGQSLETFHRAVNNVFECLLHRESGNANEVPPVDLLDIQRIRSRRRDVYREPHFSLLVANIPTLVSIESNELLSEDLRRASSSIRSATCESNDFRQSTYRSLNALRVAFEQLLMSPTMDDRLCVLLIDALRLILSDSHGSIADLGLSNWQDISSLLSPWKLAATAIQLQFVLRQIGRAMSQESSRSSASDSLDKLIFTIFRHTMTSEEAYFVAEMARGVDTPVAGKFINNGLQCLSEVLDNIPTHPGQKELVDSLERAGELLRVLAHVAEPLREDPSLLPQLEPKIQDQFINSLCAKFDMAESLSIKAADGEPPANADVLPVDDAVIFLARLVQFDLGFPGTWTAISKAASVRLTSVIFRLALVYGAGQRFDLVVFSLLVDTLYYLLDDIPSDPKGISFDPFRNYPNQRESDLPADMPQRYRAQLRTLLPYLPPNATVANLSNAHRDAAGNLLHGSPVVNRPWEWVENLGENPVHDPKEDEKEREEKERLKTKYLVKNTGSLSLELFGARLTGDGVIRRSGDSRVEGNIRTFEDGLSADSMFKRDWRETRMDLDDEMIMSGTRNRAEEEDELGNLPSFGRTERRSTSRRGSPASSVRSRTSAHGSVSGGSGSYRQSPGQSSLNRPTSSTLSEPIDVDSIATVGSTSKRTSKRKASAASDDDIEIIEGPAAAPSRAKRGKAAKTTTKTRGKKR